MPATPPDADPKKPRGSRLWLVLVGSIVLVFAAIYGGGLIWHQLTQSVPALTAKLGDKDPSVRTQAAKDLGEYGMAAQEAIPALVELLADDSPQVRSAAESALHKVDREWATRPAAARAIPQLIARLSGSRALGVPTDAARAIGTFGPYAADAVPALVRSLKDPTPPVLARTAAAHALGRIGPAAASAIPALTECLIDDPDGEVSSAAADALGKIGHAAVPSLVECLGHSDAGVRKRAARAFGEMENPPPPERAISALVGRLGDEDMGVRIQTAHVFKYVGPTAIPALVRALRTGDVTAREGVVYALASLAPASAEQTLPVLYERLKARDETIYRAAVQTLELFDAEWQTKPTAKLMLPALIHCVRDDDWLIRCRVADTLSSFGPSAKDALPVLSRQSAEDADNYCKERYQKAIRAIESPPTGER